MKKKNIFIALILFLSITLSVVGQLRTNKDKLLTIAVQGKVAPTKIANSYSTTWDGKAKLAIGVGGINYELKLGEKICGWASGDRATMGVATTGEGGAWTNYTSIGNDVKIMGGEARGEKGVIIGKFEDYVLVHFDDEVLEKLTIGTSLQVKASGIGLEIEGHKDVFVHGLSPEALENLEIKETNGKLEVPIVKEIPAKIIGQGAGRGSLSGNWHIQTCFPPDIKKYGLDGLRFGDIVILQDIQTDYGMGYYKGGATIGVVCSTPSDISGLGIGVTPILSSSTGKIIASIDPTANIAKVLGIKLEKPHHKTQSKELKTNKNQLITIAVQGEVTPAGSRGYSTTYEGKPIVHIGMGSINYTVSVGDLAYGWANADHVEPDVSFTNIDGPGLGILGCIGNEATLISGLAKGEKGIYIGKHGSSMFWFPKDVLQQLSVSDRIQVKARGVGLKIDGFEDVRVNKVSPELLENIGIEIQGDQLVVPVVKTVPGHIMGSGMGLGFFVLENVDYDIHTTCPETVEEYDLKTLRLGDLVAIQDHYDCYGRGRYEGAITIGVVIHGWSDIAGHGPGLDPILSALPGRIKVKIDPDANTAYYLGIKEKPVR
jgi:hypothetical protein